MTVYFEEVALKNIFIYNKNNSLTKFSKVGIIDKEDMFDSIENYINKKFYPEVNEAIASSVIVFLGKDLLSSIEDKNLKNSVYYTELEVILEKIADLEVEDEDDTFKYFMSNFLFYLVHLHALKRMVSKYEDNFSKMESDYYEVIKDLNIEDFATKDHTLLDGQHLINYALFLIFLSDLPEIVITDYYNRYMEIMEGEDEYEDDTEENDDDY